MPAHHRAYLWHSPSNHYRRLRFRRDALKFREYLLSLVNYMCYRDID
jgi:hypothetical protein